MQKIRIDFDNPGLPQHISAVENDSQSRFFQATLYENGKAYTAPEGAAYSIMYRGFGPQNQGWYDTINDGAGKRAACAVSGNVVTCEIARQALQVPGHVSIVLCVTTGKGYMLKSWPIECECKNDRYDSTVEIQSFFYVTQISNESWTQAIQAVEELKNTIDPTLSLSGKAADAKATGDAVGQLKEDLVDNENGILNEFVATYNTVAGKPHSSTKDRKDFSVQKGALIGITAESTEKLEYQLFGVKSDGNPDPMIGFNGSESYWYAKSDYVALGLYNTAPKENCIVKWHVWLDNSVTYSGNKINKIYKDIPLFANGNSYSNSLLTFNFGGLTDDGGVSDISYRIVSDLFLADRDYTFYIASGKRFGVSIYTSSGAFVLSSGWITDSFTIKKGEAFRIVISSTSSTTKEETKHVPIIEEDSKFLTYSSETKDTAKKNFSKEEVLSKDWIQGTVSCGLLDWHNTECISRPELIYCGGCKKLKLNQKNKDGSFWKIRCTFFDENRKLISFDGYEQKNTFDIPENAEYIRISISLYINNKVTNTTPNSYDENRYITLILIADKTYEKINSMFSDKLCKIPADATFGTYSGKKIEIAQNAIAYYKYMSIDTSVFGEQPIQGSCVYGNTLFVACNTMSKIVMYDLVLKNKIGEIVFSPVPTYHCNTINFGKQKYSESDAYPLLYVSMENIAEHKLIVLHITDSDGTYNAEAVQTITYPNPAESLQYYPNATVDNENQCIYVIGYIKDSYLEDNSNALRIRKWKLPSLSDGNVTLEIANSLKTFEIPALNCTQGALVNNGNILQCYGAHWAGDGSIYLGMISPDEQNMVTKIKMSDIGYTIEPESVFIWNCELYIMNVLGEIHRIYL